MESKPSILEGAARGFISEDVKKTSILSNNGVKKDKVSNEGELLDTIIELKAEKLLEVVKVMSSCVDTFEMEISHGRGGVVPGKLLESRKKLGEQVVSISKIINSTFREIDENKRKSKPSDNVVESDIRIFNVQGEDVIAVIVDDIMGCVVEFRQLDLCEGLTVITNAKQKHFGEFRRLYKLNSDSELKDAKFYTMSEECFILCSEIDNQFNRENLIIAGSRLFWKHKE